MEEFLKRLAEIRTRAAEIRALEVIGEAEREEIQSLVAERTEIEGKIVLEQGLIALSAEDPKVEEPAAPAEEPVVETPAEAPVEAPAEEPVVEEPTPEAIAAAIGDANVGGDMPAGGAPEGLPIVASSGAYGLQAGESLGVSSWERIHRNAASIQHATKQTFAQVVRHVGEKALTPRNSAIENSVLMAEGREGGQAMQSLVAAACYCGPNEVDKSIDTLGLDARPVAALFRSKAFTGPFDYVQDMSLAAVAGGVTIWDCTDQAAAVPGNPSTWKPCAVLDCGEAVTVTPYAIPACGLFSTFQQLSHPELVDDFIAKIGIYYARLAEQEILNRLRATSTTLTYGLAGMGLLHQLEGVLGHISGFSGYVRRIRWSDYALILGPGMLDALVADEHRRGFSQGLNRTQILARLRDLGVGQVVEALDADTSAQVDYIAAYNKYVDPGETVEFTPCDAIGTWTVHVVPVDAFVRGESTIVEAGFERDTNLIRQNMVQYFFEGHEFFEKVTPDVPNFTIELTASGTGGSSALVEPEDCTDAS